jgi:hypothetical protein
MMIDLIYCDSQIKIPRVGSFFKAFRRRASASSGHHISSNVCIIFTVSVLNEAAWLSLAMHTIFTLAIFRIATHKPF